MQQLYDRDASTSTPAASLPAVDEHQVTDAAERLDTARAADAAWREARHQAFRKRRLAICRHCMWSRKLRNKVNSHPATLAGLFGMGLLAETLNPTNPATWWGWFCLAAPPIAVVTVVNIYDFCIWKLSTPLMAINHRIAKRGGYAYRL